MANLIQLQRLQRPITPTGSQQVSTGITPVQSLVPVVQPQRFYYTRRPTNSSFTDYNDPNQINSMADVVVNSITDSIRDIKAGTFVPFKNTFQNASEYLNNVIIDPIKDMNPVALGVNLLSGLGESLDIIDNGAKGLILGGKRAAERGESFFKGAGEGFLDAYNLRGKGRVNWDADTGNFITDVAAEILMSPSTWLTLGTAPLARAASKELSQVITKETMQKINKELTQETAEYVSKRAVKAFINGQADDIASAVKKELHTIATSKTPLRFIKGEAGEDIAKITKEVKAVATLVENVGTTYQADKILNAVSKLTVTRDTVESAISRFAFAGTLIPPAFKFATHMIGDWRTISRLSKYKAFEQGVTTANKTIDTFKFDDVKNFINREALTAKVLDGTIAQSDEVGTQLQQVLHDSLSKDLFTINSLYQKHKTDPQKFLEEVEKILSLPPGKTFKDYIENVQRIASEVDDLDDVIKVYKELGNNVELYTKNIKLKEAATVSNDILDSIDDGVSAVRKTLGIEDVETEKLMEEVADSSMIDTVLDIEDKYTQHILSLRKTIANAHQTPQGVDRKFRIAMGTQLKADLEDAVAPFLEEIREGFLGRTIKALDSDATSKAYDVFRNLIGRYVDDFTNTVYKNIDEYVISYQKILRDVTFGMTDIPALKEFDFDSLKTLYNKMVKELDNFNTKHIRLDKIPELKDLAKVHKDDVVTMLTTTPENKTLLDKIIRLAQNESKGIASSDFVFKAGGTLKDANKALEFEKATADLKRMYAQVNELVFEDGRSIFEYVPFAEGDGGLNAEIVEAIQELEHSVNKTPEDYVDAWYKLRDKLRDTSEEGANKEALNLLDEIAPESFIRTEVAITGDTTIYTLKQEQAYSLLSMMQNPDMLELHEAINSNSGIGMYINQLASLEVPETDVLFQASLAAKSIKKNLEYYTNVKYFLDSLTSLPVDTNIKEGFLSTVQNYARKDVIGAIDDFDYIFDKIIEGTEMHSYSRNMQESLKLDVFRDNNPEILKALENAEQLKNRAGHDALFDSYTEEYYIKEKGFMEKYFNNPNVNYVTFDIETLNNRVFEIGVKPIGKDGSIFNRTIDRALAEDQPSVSLLAVFGGDEEKFFKTRQPLEPTTEKEMFEQFIGNLQKLHAEKPVELIGHNIDQFDTPQIIRRMKAVGVDRNYIEFFNNLAKHDSLKYAKLENGGTPIFENAKAMLRTLFKSYVETQGALGPGKLLEPVNINLVKDLNEIAGVMFQLKAIKGNSLQNLVGNSGIDVFMAATNLKSYAASISNALAEVRNNNSALSRVLVSSDVFSEPTTEFMQKYNKLLRDSGIAEEEYMNITKLLYTGRTEGLSMLGAKTAVKSKNILEWFDVNDGDVMNINTAKRLTRSSYRLNNIREKVYIPEVLNTISLKVREGSIVNSERFDSLLEYLVYNFNKQHPDTTEAFLGRIQKVSSKEAVFDISNIPSEFKYLKKLPGDTLGEYAQLQYIYNTLKYYSENAPKNTARVNVVQPKAGYKGLKLNGADGNVPHRFMEDPLRAAQTRRNLNIEKYLERLDKLQSLKSKEGYSQRVEALEKKLQTQRDTILEELKKGMDAGEADTYIREAEFRGNVTLDEIAEEGKRADDQLRGTVEGELANKDIYQAAFDRFKELASEDLLKILEQPDSVKRRAIENIKDLNEHVADPKTFDLISKTFNKNVDSLYELSDLFDMNGKMFRGKAQVMSSMIRPVQTLIDNFNKFLGTNTLDRMNNLRVVREFTDELRVTQTAQQLSLQGDELLSFMLHEAPWFEFAKSDIAKGSRLHDTYINFLKNVGESSDMIKATEVGDRVYVYLTQEAYSKYTPIYDGELGYVKWDGPQGVLARPELKAIDATNLSIDAIRGDLTKAQELLTTLSEGRAIGSSYEAIKLKDMEELYKKLPEEIVKEMPNLKALSNKELWKAPRFNYINVGSTNSRALKNEFIPHNIVGSIKSASEHAIVKAKNQITYTAYYYAPDFSINLSPAFSNPAFDNEILQAFKDNPEYILTALIEDPKLGHRAIKINPTSKAALEEARRLNAIVVPRHTYQELSESINLGLLSELKGNFFSKLMYTYKMGYLMSPGAMLRNYVDSTLKTMFSTGENIFSVIKSQKEGSQMLSSYDKIVKNIMSMGDGANVKALLERKELFDQANGILAKEQAQASMTIAKLEMDMDDIEKKIMKMDRHKRYTVDNERFYFEKLRLPSEMDYETYKFIDGLVKDGWGAGQTSAWRAYTTEIINKKVGKNGSASDKMWNKFVQGMNYLMTPNTKIEQWNRMGQYVLLAKGGTPNTKAFMEIVKTHFDYGDKSKAQLIAEYVFPFYTYTMKNLEYWYDIAENNPRVLMTLENLLTPTLNLDEYDHKELTKNRSLQYQIMSGAIPLYDVGDSTFTLKLSPSALDAFKLSYNPVGELGEKVFGPYKNIVGAATDNEGILGFGADAGPGEGQSGLSFAMEQLPIVGTMLQRYGDTGQRNYGRTGNILNAILPDVFGATSRFKNFPTSGKNYTPYARRVYAKKPRRVFTKQRRYAKKSYTKKRWAKKTYADRSYAKRSYANTAYNSWVYPNARSRQSIYKKHYSSSGKSRFKSLLMPTTPSRLRYQLVNYNMIYR